jgi:hypothetical protein
VTLTQNQILWAAVGGLLAAMLLWMGSVNPLLAMSFSNFAHIPLFMVALGLTPLATLLGVIAGATALVIVPFALGGDSGSGLTLVYLLAIAAPALLIGHFALLFRNNSLGEKVFYPLGRILLWLCLCAGLIYSAGFWSSSDGSWAAQIQAEVIKLLQQQMPPDAEIPPQELAELVGTVLPYLPGAALAMVALTIIVNAVIAQWILHARQLAVRPMPQMADIDLPHFMPLLVAGLAVLAAFSPIQDLGTWASNFLMILLVPLLLAGLSVLHAVLAKNPQRMIWLLLIYSALILSPAVLFLPVLVIAVLGLGEQWIEAKTKFLSS